MGRELDWGEAAGRSTYAPRQRVSDQLATARSEPIRIKQPPRLTLDHWPSPSLGNSIDLVICLPKPLGNFDPDDRTDNSLMRSFLQ